MEGTIIDVRSYQEYLGGHVAGSILIPLQEIPDRLDEIRQFSQPIILCCASGNRSAQATQFLQNQGINCSDGGSWMDLDVNS
nr:rhodanese-like domain-containing protein [uncultured Fluviicola sp.]